MTIRRFVTFNFCLSRLSYRWIFNFIFFSFYSCFRMRHFWFRYFPVKFIIFSSFSQSQLSPARTFNLNLKFLHSVDDENGDDRRPFETFVEFQSVFFLLLLFTSSISTCVCLNASMTYFPFLYFYLSIVRRRPIEGN